MTKREALRLIINAADNVASTGRGIRPQISDEQRRRVKLAVATLYADAWHRLPDENDLYNLGL